MRNGRFVLPVGDEGTRLYLFVIRSGNARAPRVFVNPFIRYKDKRSATLHTSTDIRKNRRLVNSEYMFELLQMFSSNIRKYVARYPYISVTNILFLYVFL